MHLDLGATSCMGEGWGFRFLCPQISTQQKPPSLLMGPAWGNWPATYTIGVSGARPALVNHVRQIERLWARQTLAVMVGGGEDTFNDRDQTAGPCTAQVLPSLPLSQSHRTLEPAPQGHCAPSVVKEPSELGGA